MYSKPAIIKKIGLIGSEGSDGAHVKVFSEEEQFELFVQAYDDFSGAMDFTNLINYFKDLSNVLNNTNNKFKK